MIYILNRSKLSGTTAAIKCVSMLAPCTIMCVGVFAPLERKTKKRYVQPESWIPYSAHSVTSIDEETATTATAAAVKIAKMRCVARTLISNSRLLFVLRFWDFVFLKWNIQKCLNGGQKSKRSVYKWGKFNRYTFPKRWISYLESNAYTRDKVPVLFPVQSYGKKYRYLTAR